MLERKYSGAKVDIVRGAGGGRPPPIVLFRRFPLLF